jgi:hypothetical protein
LVVDDLSFADEDLMKPYRCKIQWLVSIAKIIDLPDPWEQEISSAADGNIDFMKN